MMKIVFAVVSIVLFSFFSFATETNGVLKSIHAPYKEIKTLAVEMHRTSEMQNGKNLKTLSTVYFKRDDKFHSETVSPIHRRVIADGKNFKMYIDDNPFGVKSIIDQLPSEMLANMRAVPGSPESFLMAFDGAKEELLSSDDSKKLIGLSSKDGYCVLEIDSIGRINKYSVYPSKESKEEIMSIIFTDFFEPVSGAWIAKKHTSTVVINGKKFKDVLKLVNICVNEEIADSLFNHDAYFSGVTFENL